MATKQLFLLRHAKSSWDDPGLNDHDRPLAPRGRKAVKLLAEHVRVREIHPTQVLCSSSRRTLETLDGVAPGGEALIEEDIYGASCDQVLERLRSVPDTAESVMVIGHNPAMQVLVLRLIGSNGRVSADEGPDLDELRRKFPTGALATLRFDCSWRELSAGCAELVDYVRPRTLA